MRKPYSALLPLGLAAAFAVETRTWTHESQQDFQKGKLEKLALRSDGRLSLAPRFTELFDPSLNYLWALAEDSKGRLYAGGGGADANAAKLYVIEPGQKGRLLTELSGLAVHAIAIDRQDRVYAATSPDGKVWRIADGKPELFYDPKAKYIWALAFSSKGELYVATGDKGEVHKVASNGQAGVFYKTEETHARSMAIDADGNVLVGTEPSGLVLRISPSGQGFVLYQTAKREVTAILAGGDGIVYAASVGNKQPATAPPPPAPQPAEQPASPAPSAGGQGAQITVQRAGAPPPPQIGSMSAGVTGGSEVYAIEKDGYARRVWSHASDIVYALALDRTGRPLLGTGNRGALYRLDSELLYTTLLSAAPTQITALCRGREGRLYAASGNIGKVYQLGPDVEKQGSFESEPLDAGFFTHWGRLSYKGAEAGGKVSAETRSGNLDRPQQGWSAWSPVPLGVDGGRVASPAARFLQYKLTLEASPKGETPEIAGVEVAWLPKNAMPLVELIETTRPNYRFPPQTLTLTPSTNLTLPALSRTRTAASPPSIPSSGSTSMQYAKGYAGARWLASDPNGDALEYKVEIRGETEKEWKLLKGELKDAVHSWDSTAFPDGRYRLRVTVTDSPDNPTDQALRSSLESDEFTIDNTGPSIAIASARRTGSRLEVSFKATDALNRIDKAEYSLNGGAWRVVEPTTRLSDSRAHEYLLSIEAPGAGEHTVAVRVTDAFDNQTVEKTIVR